MQLNIDIEGSESFDASLHKYLIQAEEEKKKYHFHFILCQRRLSMNISVCRLEHNGAHKIRLM